MSVESIIKLGAGAALLWYGVLRGAKGLIVKVYNYTFRGIDTTTGTVQLSLNFLVKNPLLVGLTLKGISGDIYIQGQNVGFVNTTVDYYLSGGHTHIVPVVANLTMAGAAAAALANIQSGDVRTLTISFNGRVLVGTWNVPIPVQIDLDYNDLMQ